MKPKISLIVLTYNEEANLPKCLKSVEGLVSEIIVVDSGSIDKTLEIAKKFDAKTFHHEFKNQADLFNWALAHTDPSGDWTMRLDADEELLPELVAEIEEKLPTLPAEINGVVLRRRVYFMGRWIRHGGYYPTDLLRIFRKGKGMSEEREMDEHLILKEGKEITLENDFIDNNLKGFKFWKEKHRAYAAREAKTLIAGEKNESGLGLEAGRKRWLKMNVYYRAPAFLRVLAYFIYRYFFLLGFLDGWAGAKFHFYQGFWYRWIVDVNICRLKKSDKYA